MSRVGKAPVMIPSGVQIGIESGVVNVQGPKGKLSLQLSHGIKVEKEGSLLKVIPTAKDRQASSNFGTTRAKLNSMVAGVTKGWKKTLELTGVGYNVTVNGQKIKIVCGFSHDVNMVLPAGIKATAEKTTLHLESADKELLGTVAASIHDVKPPEPYLGKGIRYSDQKIRRKAGKAGKK